MDIKSLTQVLRLSMLSSITSDDSLSTQNNNTQTSEIFQLLLQEMLQSSSGNSTNSVPQQITSINDGETTNTNTELAGSSNGSSSSDIEDAIKKAAQKYGVDEDFIKAVIKQESGFHPDSVSKAGAEGLMQLMPKTAESLGVKNPFDVLENVDGGTKYIKNLMDAFGGSKELALSAYNGGISRMNRRGVDTVGEISNMPSETQNYVAKVMKAYEGYKKG